MLLLPQLIGGLTIPTCGYRNGRPRRPTREFAVTRYILRGCPRCGGDLFIHDQYQRKDDWLCLQCGRYRHRGRLRPAGNAFPRCGSAQVSYSRAGRLPEREAG